MAITGRDNAQQAVVLKTTLNIGEHTPHHNVDTLPVPHYTALTLISDAVVAVTNAIAARLGTLGQKAMGASTPVAIASDQSAVPVSASALPLPAGAATNTFLGTLLGTLGQKGMAASTPVAIASDQSAVPVSASALPLPTGAATNTFLGTLLGTLGQKAMAASTPVTLASDQTAVPISNTALDDSLKELPPTADQTPLTAASTSSIAIALSAGYWTFRCLTPAAAGMTGVSLLFGGSGVAAATANSWLLGPEQEKTWYIPAGSAFFRHIRRGTVDAMFQYYKSGN